MPTIVNLTDRELEVPRAFGARIPVPPGGHLDVETGEVGSYTSQSDIWGLVEDKKKSTTTGSE